MWPLSPPRARARLAWEASSGQGARHAAGSRLPCRATPGPTLRAGDVQRDPPVDTHDVRACFPEQREDLAGADAEDYARHVKVGNAFQHAPQRREHVAAVVEG